MKNHLTLIVASLLLILCVVEKHASYKAEKNVNVENMYNFPDKNINNSSTSNESDGELMGKTKSLYDPAQLFQFASMDTTSRVASEKVNNQNLLNIPQANRTANF
ncbi:hypothetical protein [Dyadobacter luticola]|uniref:Uncharacterized protein n=1 Tax=Dyadobacter luticola TaxID=1979387 RepID=A0A5R9KV43_9BACT|nr:hypothetical protein [Dyadobacter luticola]TLV00015.1 hypothetical protein FEN17_10905 [Dyadobacter luticola]